MKQLNTRISEELYKKLKNYKNIKNQSYQKIITELIEKKLVMYEIAHSKNLSDTSISN